MVASSPYIDCSSAVTLGGNSNVRAGEGETVDEEEGEGEGEAVDGPGCMAYRRRAIDDAKMQGRAMQGCMHLLCTSMGACRKSRTHWSTRSSALRRCSCNYEACLAGTAL